MSKIYTTEELIQILNQERQACLKGERLNLRATPAVGNPVVDCFLKPEGIQKFTAYQNFKATIHQYQQEHQVSGIVWREIIVREKTLQFPFVNEQLIALPYDLEQLKAAKIKLLAFWDDVTAGMDLYLSLNSGKDYRQICVEEVDAIIQRTEWACIWKWEKSSFLEMLLQLGWGQPSESGDRRGWPQSGSENIHAVKPGQHPIG
ncbi:hypothetical protein [Planktothrix agardhii]|jgi:hypothetical protein|uniref:Uncharacterized protein n=2 Tax=Planktothrix agardhii TaxID=1160 RepID=A0A073CF83_PLAA1|nr:hypothetical protein [Planktothrix agardhii]MCF3607191.1 hypothetical protein [Planktothrix agardhii 1033]BBD53032.1 hypothetical protein NIES204_02950 [Planktothrix agardhii NIES-204]KEI66959.1 hypothetical protein A19Y_1988 [Planktothrix agardhii NIVA-CYA 126/8]MBG0747246.1 hypothetical protein [Planktothrix agardhii KL2]MCB8751360.1 hypothetical protein [Planktothrix agardhii 1810]